MQPTVLDELDQVTTAWLTDVLTHSGALRAGQVVAFDSAHGGGNWSGNARLRLTYSADAAGDCPRALFLKLVNTDTGDGEFFLPLEVEVYTRLYRDLAAAPLLRCYAAAYDALRHRYHLLLDDVSATHSDMRARTPTADYGAALAEGLATLHAHNWGAARLAALGAPRHDAAHIRRYFAIAAPGVAHLKAQLAAELQPHWPALVDAIFSHLPDRLIARTAGGGDLTLIHGDPNPGNIMTPHAGARPLYLIDCQPFDWSLTTWSGAYDLAYAIALYWETPTRRALEAAVLQRYHAGLRQHGVGDYPWQRLYDDYRLNVALCVVVAVEYLRGGDLRWRDFIVGLLRRTLTACDDLAVATLWSA